MTILAKYAYDAGVGMGLASFQASVQQTGLALDALKSAIKSANDLKSNQIGDPGKINFTGIHDQIARDRVEYEKSIRGSNNAIANDLANCYLLGLYLAMAEGHTTSHPWNKACGFANSNIKAAERLMNENLSKVYFDREKINSALMQTENMGRAQNDAYHAALALRVDCGTALERSSFPEPPTKPYSISVPNKHLSAPPTKKRITLKAPKKPK